MGICMGIGEMNRKRRVAGGGYAAGDRRRGGRNGRYQVGNNERYWKE